jgi:hypothetical protein
MSQVTKITNEQLLERIEQLEEALRKKRGTASTREMTDDDAKRVLSGDLREVNHKNAAEKLGLSYGQVYSCRLEYTFKHIHKELKKQENYKSLWVK